MIQPMKTRLLVDPANESKRSVIDRRMIQPMKIRLIDDSSGRTQLSFSQVFELNVQNVRYYSISTTEVRILLKFSNTDLSTFGIISSQTLFILFIMSKLMVGVFS